MQPHDRTRTAAEQAAVDAELMRATASAQISDDQARRVRMHKLAAAMARQENRLQRKRRV